MAQNINSHDCEDYHLESWLRWLPSKNKTSVQIPWTHVKASHTPPRCGHSSTTLGWVGSSWGLLVSRSSQSVSTGFTYLPSLKRWGARRLLWPVRVCTPLHGCWYTHSNTHTHIPSEGTTGPYSVSLHLFPFITPQNSWIIFLSLQ